MTEPAAYAANREKPAKGPRYLPGDLPPAAHRIRMIRVDQAGEYGAKRIYDGQLSVLRGGPAAPVIRQMAEQEIRHLREFDRLMISRRVRPTALSPLWHVAGYALGAGSALLGKEAAMACTVAVEEVIDRHYARQEDALADEDPALRRMVAEFRAEEIEHRDTGLAHGAERTPGYAVLTTLVKAGTRAAIWLSERV